MTALSRQEMTLRVVSSAEILMHAQDAYHLGCPRVKHGGGSLDTERLLKIYYDACVRCF